MRIFRNYLKMENLNFKGTKGKWAVSIPNDGSIIMNGNVRAQVLSYHDNGNTNEDLANAKLISAAPDLLEALFYTLKALDAITILRKPEAIIKAAELAIEKALK